MSYKNIVVVLFSISLLSAVVVPSYQNLKVKSLQAEAEVMLSYLAALEGAYYTDKGKYVIFSEHYGAQELGKNNCTRSPGVIELGFLLKSCEKDPMKGGLRYFYWVEGGLDEKTGQKTMNNTFFGYAESGSEVGAKSLVCVGSDEKDIWIVDTTKKQKNISNCK